MGIFLSNLGNFVRFFGHNSGAAKMQKAPLSEQGPKKLGQAQSNFFSQEVFLFIGDINENWSWSQ